MNIIFGAGIIGEATLYACRKRGISVECFVDDRIKGPLLGLPVIRTTELEYLYPKAKFYLTSPNIEDMIRPLRSMGYEEWKSCGDVLADFDVSGILNSESFGISIPSVNLPTLSS